VREFYLGKLKWAIETDVLIHFGFMSGFLKRSVSHGGTGATEIGRAGCLGFGFCRRFAVPAGHSPVCVCSVRACSSSKLGRSPFGRTLNERLCFNADEPFAQCGSILKQDSFVRISPKLKRSVRK
jgi:hypothetical protein